MQSLGVAYPVLGEVPGSEVLMKQPELSGKDTKEQEARNTNVSIYL